MVTALRWLARREAVEIAIYAIVIGSIVWVVVVVYAVIWVRDKLRKL